MLNKRENLEARETNVLAPYAQFAGESGGRKHREKQHPYRTEYQRDRARIIHSKAFRRLEYKTQVFLNGTGDHLRTRLTHTIEVASISRTIASALRLNEDLAEAISLAHDLGHSPFGHSGEETLNGLMSAHGGFDHNRQSLRLVEMLEKKYPRFAGLNLSFEVLEGLQKHRKFYDPSPKITVSEKNESRENNPTSEPYTCPSLEAQIANLADEITYYSHDLDDGLEAALIHAEQLAELDAWQEIYDEVRTHFPKLKGHDLSTYVIRCMIDREVQDVILTSHARIEKSGVENVEAVRHQKQPLIRYSEPLLKANRELRKFLYGNLYYNPQVLDVNQRACGMLKDVFEAYLQNPKLLGNEAAKRLPHDGLHRAVCDYLAGMTDRYLLNEHQRLFGG